jgi:hypothetical protein
MRPLVTGVTCSLCRNRNNRISPARSWPKALMRTLLSLLATSRPNKRAPLFAGDGRQTVPAQPPTVASAILTGEAYIQITLRAQGLDAPLEAANRLAADAARKIACAGRTIR